MNILLVEDNISIVEDIQDYLVDHKIFHSPNLEGAYKILKNNKIDFAILDRMLPDGEGIELARHIKQTNKNIGIIMTTARGQLDDKIQGFGNGVDDYLTKPFDLKELEIRINAISKRSDGEKNIFSWRNFQFNLEKQTLSDGEKIIPLTNIEFLILKILINANGSLISRTQILDEVWGEEGLWGGDNKLDVYISGLRKKIHKDFIETQKGAGYRIGI